MTDQELNMWGRHMIDTIGRYRAEFNNLRIRKACPFCRCRDTEIVSFDDLGLHYIACKACHSTGPAKETVNAAIKAWNREEAK